jgi:hypothetical protein
VDNLDGGFRCINPFRFESEFGESGGHESEDLFTFGAIFAPDFEDQIVESVPRLDEEVIVHNFP